MLRPLKDKIIVELIQKEKTTASGIVLTSTDPTEVSKGLVLKVGPEVVEVKEGDTILADWNKATKTKFEGQDFYIVTEENIVLVFED